MTLVWDGGVWNDGTWDDIGAVGGGPTVDISGRYVDAFGRPAQGSLTFIPNSNRFVVGADIVETGIVAATIAGDVAVRLARCAAGYTVTERFVGVDDFTYLLPDSATPILLGGTVGTVTYSTIVGSYLDSDDVTPLQGTITYTPKVRPNNNHGTLVIGPATCAIVAGQIDCSLVRCTAGYTVTEQIDGWPAVSYDIPDLAALDLKDYG